MHQSQSEPLQSSEEMSLSQPSHQSQFSNFSDTSEGQQCKEQNKIEAVNKLLEALTISPIKDNESQAGIERKLSQVSATAKDLFKVPRTEVPNVQSSEVNDLNSIMRNVKTRIAGKPFEECLPYLTLLPHDWSYKKYQDEFDLTRHSVKVIKNMQQQQLEKRERKKRSDAIDNAIIQRCVEFYRKPYISRELPGKFNKSSLII